MGKWYEDPALWWSLVGFGGVMAALELAGLNPVSQITAAAGDAAWSVTNVFDRGDRLSYGTAGPDGTIVDDPEALRMAASTRYGSDIPRDVYALARMVRSEGAKQGDVRVHVALNDLAALGWADPYTLITYSTVAARKGKYGNQGSRRYSSEQDPYTGDVQTVIQAMDAHDSGDDPSQGATKFVDVSSMGGVQPGTSSFDALVAKWAPEGLVPYTLPQYGSDLVFFKKGGLDNVG